MYKGKITLCCNISLDTSEFCTVYYVQFYLIPYILWTVCVCICICICICYCISKHLCLCIFVDIFKIFVKLLYFSFQDSLYFYFPLYLYLCWIPMVVMQLWASQATGSAAPIPPASHSDAFEQIVDSFVTFENTHWRNGSLTPNIQFHLTLSRLAIFTSC